MINYFLTALIHAIVAFLAKHTDFFDGNVNAREKTLESLRVPAAFKHYLSHRSMEDFMSDLSLTLSYIKSSKTAEIEANAFFKAVLEFFTGVFADKLDKLNADFYSFKEKDRWRVVSELIKGESHLAESLRLLLMNYTYQDLSAELINLGQRVVNAAYVVVQSPREITPKLKQEIRHSLLKEQPLAFPVFQINKKLIGGLRIFKNGQVHDHSWVARVQSFISLNSV